MSDLSRRPKFAYWLFDRSVTAAAAAEALGCSQQYVSLLCKPFSDPGRRTPSFAMMEKVRAYTDGAIQPNDWLQSEDAAA